MTESALLPAIRRRASELGARVLRNNVGIAWQGDAQHLPDGSILIRKPRRVVYGLHPGSSDLIGWTPVEITPDMVGQTLAVFTSLEVKAPRGRLRAAQDRWLAAVRAAGGIADAVRSVEDAERIITRGSPAG